MICNFIYEKKKKKRFESGDVGTTPELHCIYNSRIHDGKHEMMIIDFIGSMEGAI